MRVQAIVDYDGTGTDGAALLMPLQRAQQLFGQPGRIKYVLVSNRGGVISGAALTNQVVRTLRPALTPLHLQANKTKADTLKLADATGSAFVSMFTTFGSFSIAAGILLIFLIFIMLAAERRGELGIARAVGTRQRNLVQMFLFEGVAYDVLAAAVGAAARRRHRLPDGAGDRRRVRPDDRIPHHLLRDVAHGDRLLRARRPAHVRGRDGIGVAGERG